jgi:hypothetical protein
METAMSRKDLMILINKPSGFAVSGSSRLFQAHRFSNG